MNEPLRYKLDQVFIHKLAYDHNGKETFPIRKTPNFNERAGGQEPIWVNILEQPDKHWAKLQLCYANGEVVVGWTWTMTVMNPLVIHGMDQLFDGRFNASF